MYGEHACPVSWGLVPTPFAVVEKRGIVVEGPTATWVDGKVRDKLGFGTTPTPCAYT